MQAFGEGDVYPLLSSSVFSYPQACVVIRQSGDIWHRRLGHNCAHTLDRLRKNN